MAPPRPARKDPRKKILVNSRAWFTPKASDISRSSVAARTKIPQRVRFSNSHNPIRIIAARTISAMSYWGSSVPMISMLLSNPGACGPSKSSAPNSHLDRSWIIKTMPKVANRINSSGAWYNRLSSNISIISPSTPTIKAASRILAQKDKALSGRYRIR